jgi:hypothetical protein
VAYFNPPTWALNIIENHFPNVPIITQEDYYIIGLQTTRLSTIVPIGYGGVNTMNINAYIDVNLKHELSNISVYI